ncbi:MAG: ubiquitin-like domain-containing protein [Acutalibacteraceae bacterium]
MFLVRIKRPKTKAQKRHRIIALAVLLTLLLSGSTVAVVAASKMVKTTVEFDGQSVTVTSFSQDPYEIVMKAGAKLNSGDELELENFDAESDENSISVARAYNVTVKDGNQAAASVRCCGTVADALEKADITLNDKDKLNCSADMQLYENLNIVVNRSFKAVVTADGKSKTFSITGCSVEELLKKAGITLSKNDIVNYGLSEPVTAGMEVKVERVKYKTKKKIIPLDFYVENQNTDSLYVGQTKVARQGEKGEQTLYYSCKYVDGKLEKKELVMTETTKSPVNKIVLHGTKTLPASSVGVISQLQPTTPVELDANGRPVKYKKVIVGQATAYSNDAVTATGQRTMPGRVAVNPKQIPYGTKMYIVSSDGKYVYGYCEASDTGGFIYNSKTVVDLYFNTESECVRFGRRNVEIYILE